MRLFWIIFLILYWCKLAGFNIVKIFKKKRKECIYNKIKNLENDYDIMNFVYVNTTIIHKSIRMLNYLINNNTVVFQ